MVSLESLQGVDESPVKSELRKLLTMLNELNLDEQEFAVLRNMTMLKGKYFAIIVN